MSAPWAARSGVFRVGALRPLDFNLQQTGAITGGTGRFAAATGSSTAVVVARGLLARNADGSCSQERVPIAEVDTISSNGTLSF